MQQLHFFEVITQELITWYYLQGKNLLICPNASLGFLTQIFNSRFLSLHYKQCFAKMIEVRSRSLSKYENHLQIFYIKLEYN